MKVFRIPTERCSMAKHGLVNLSIVHHNVRSTCGAWGREVDGVRAEVLIGEQR